MPFQSPKQRRYMHANLPEIANRWEAKYGLGGIADLNAELNSLPEYFMNSIPAAQGGRIGFAEGPTPDTFWKDKERKKFYKIMQEWEEYQRNYEREKRRRSGIQDVAHGGRIGFDKGGEGYVALDAKQLWEKTMLENYQPTEEEKRLIQIYLSMMNKGGMVPSHQAGIYGLAEGGRTGLRFGGNPHEASQGSPDAGQSGDHHGDVAHGEGGRFNQPAQPPDPSETVGDTSNYPNVHKDETAEETKKAVKEGERKKALRNLALQGQKTETWEKEQNWQKPSVWGKIGQGLLTLATFGVLGPGAAKLAKAWSTGTKIKAFADTGKINLPFDKQIDLSNQLSKITNKLQSSAAEKDLYKSLPDGHPEKISLQAELEIGKEPPTADSENRGTNIVIDNIEEVNDAKTTLLSKYQEMNDASTAAWARQRELQAKKEAHLRNLRKTYMSAGGRVPAGYNTGGLSNLFRLKNV